ncbi:MAG: ABC transporter ATP-binding protein [Chitinophagaceae bacterium]|nr:ABC transporter ATP-binding protein [Anaerolineae bacterium]
MRRHPLVFFGLMFGAFTNAALAAVVPYFIGLAFNRMIETDGRDIVYVGTMALAIVISQTIRGVLQLMRNASAETFGQRIERDVRGELYASLLGKSMTFHDLMPVGEIMARVTNDVREMNLMMNPGVNLIIGSGWFLILPVVSAPFIHPALLLVPLVFVFLHIIVQYRFVVRMQPVAFGTRESFGRMNAELAESLDGLQIVKGAAQEQHEIKKFNKLAEDVRDYFVAQGKIEAQYLSNLLLGLAVVIGFIHSIYLFQLGWIDIGNIVAYASLLSLFSFPVFTSLNSLSRLALGYASAGRILEIINNETALDRNLNGYKTSIKGAVKFEDVSFTYTEGGKIVLHNISFEAQPGQTVAVVGQTGSGKTSLMKLVNRTYDAASGRVLVDGVDVREWDLEALRSQISIIEQDIFLFSRTIAENIAFGNISATQEQIEDAARKAQAHDFIVDFPEGYDTIIGQRGVTLSGGQRQRLAIARAFLTNPPILILDDSTSAIDSATEDRIQQAIWAASRGRTTLLITHRLSQIRWADHIIVLKQGRIVGQGTHDNLLGSSEAYRRIFARYEEAQPEKI